MRLVTFLLMGFLLLMAVPALATPSIGGDTIEGYVTYYAGGGGYGPYGIAIGATVELVDEATGNVVDQYTTNFEGKYIFVNVDPGRYYVQATYQYNSDILTGENCCVDFTDPWWNVEGFNIAVELSDARGTEQVIYDPIGDASIPHIDVTKFSIFINEELLTVTFHLVDLPEQLPFNRVGVAVGEYLWEVYIDVDNNQTTGRKAIYLGIEYILSAFFFSDNESSVSVEPIQNRVEADVLEPDIDHENGWTSYPGGASLVSFVMNTDDNTITLSGIIPGLSSNSKIYFRTFDYNPEDQHEGDYRSESSEEVESYIVLTENSEPFSLSPGSYVVAYGSDGMNTLNVAESAHLQCRNFIGENEINIQEVSSEFTVYRSGATVYLNSTSGTRVEIPATETSQTLRFADGSLELEIIAGNVMLGNQVVGQTEQSIDSDVISVNYNSRRTTIKIPEI